MVLHLSSCRISQVVVLHNVVMLFVVVLVVGLSASMAPSLLGTLCPDMVVPSSFVVALSIWTQR